MTGPWVADLQRKLVARGYLTLKSMATGPGVFGPRTEQAVKGLQVEAGLPETGMVGARTWAALNGEIFSPVQRAIDSSRS
jgi:peptidoglycan hydrolase-like protein with peptidoglycan-binding domain